MPESKNDIPVTLKTDEDQLCLFFGDVKVAYFREGFIDLICLEPADSDYLKMHEISLKKTRYNTKILVG